MENMIKQAFYLFEQIGSTTSRTAKEDFLKQGASNSVFKDLLFRCYNTYMLFYVKKNPKVKLLNLKHQSMSIVDRYNGFTELLDRLNQRKVTGNEALAELSAVLEQMTEEEYKWYVRILQKDLKIGITEKTINSVFPNFIPSFTCMLAEKLNKYPKRFAYQRKIDGYRYCGFVYNSNRIEPKTRNGKTFEGYDGVEAALATLPEGFMYDGEIIDRDGTFNSTQKSAFKKTSGKDGVLNIFDMVSIVEFETGNFTTPYEKRLEMLESIRALVDASPYLQLAPYEVYKLDPKAADEFITAKHDDYVLEGYEGLVVKDLDAVYKLDKGRAIQKVKKFFDIDLTVIDVEEGAEDSQFEGTLGALVVELSDKDIIQQLGKGQPYVEGGTFKVKVGSGFKVLPHHEYNRDVLWARKEDLINRTIEIRCFGSTLNDKGGHSLRFPIFKKFRDDK